MSANQQQVFPPPESWGFHEGGIYCAPDNHHWRAAQYGYDACYWCSMIRKASGYS